MKGKRMMTGLSFIDPKYIQEAEDEIHMKNENNVKRSGRRLGPVLLAACLIFALAGAAFAANVFGLRDLLQNMNRNYPEDAYKYIHSEDVTVEKTGWSCTLAESLGDVNTVMATVNVNGGDKYIVVPTDAMPEDSVEIIGLSETQTLDEFAKTQGKKLLFVGASITKVGDTTMLVGSQHMENRSESEMVILTTSTMHSPVAGGNAICQVYAREAGSEDVQIVELPFTLKQAPAGETRTYQPDNPNAIACMTVGNATITKSPLGYSVTYTETIVDEAAYYDLMKTELVGLDSYQGGSVDNGDGSCTFRADNCQGTLGDTLTVNYYNWDKEIVGTIEFHITSD